MISHRNILRIGREARQRRKGIHEFLGLAGDALSGLPKLLDHPVFWVAGGDT